MATQVKEGENFVITFLDRIFGGRETDAFTVDGKTGKVTFGKNVEVLGTATLSGAPAALATNLVLATKTKKTIAAGVIAATQSLHYIETEASAASDDLDTISGTVAGQLYVFYPFSAADTVVFKHGTGNIFCVGGQDISLAEATDYVLAVSNGTSVIVMAASTLAADVGSGRIQAGAVTLTKLAAASIDGTAAKVLAESNIIGAIPVVHVIPVANVATHDVDVVLTHKTRITGVEVVKTNGAGGAADTIAVKNGATAITNALDLNVADKAIVRASTLDDAQWEIAAGGTLRVASVNGGAGDVTCKVIVTGFRVA
jgi:hypothetical protein